MKTSSRKKIISGRKVELIDKEFEHIPSLDGVRGLSLLLVIGFHLQLFGMLAALPLQLQLIASISWVSVDMFFVLSGFLITSILLRTRESPHYFKNFYVRRILRILPLYYLALFIIFVICPNFSIGSTSDFSKIYDNKFWFLFYIQNIYIATRHEFFAFGINDLWTLAIEEQFYIVWPLFIYFIQKKWLKATAITIITMVLLMRIVLVCNDVNWSFNYYFTLCRIDSICFGALGAILLHENYTKQQLTTIVRILTIISITGLGIIFYKQEGFLISQNYTSSIGFTFIDALFFVLIIKLASGKMSILKKMFEFPFLRFIGKISYCMYIIHNPLIQFSKLYIIPITKTNDFFYRSLTGNIVFVIIYLCIIISISLISWHLFEKWFLKLKRYF